MIQFKVLASLITFAFVFTALGSLSQHTHAQELTAPESEDKFQNSLRARSMIDLEAQLSQTATVPVVCLARLKIVEFIFTNGVHEQFEDANRMATDCIGKALQKDGSYSEITGRRVLGTMMSLLRAYSPEKAIELEKRLPHDALSVNSSDYDYFTTDSQLENLERIVISQLKKKEFVSGLFTVLMHFTWESKTRAEAFKQSILDVWESQFRTGKRVSTAFAVDEYFVHAKPSTRIRYLNFVVEVAVAASSTDHPQWYLSNIREALARHLGQIKREQPEKFDTATSTLQILTSKLDKEHKTYAEDWDLYRESKGNLEKSTRALKVASSESVRNNLLGEIASLSGRSGDYKTQIDSYLAREYPYVYGQVHHVNLIRYNVLPEAIRKGKLELVEYAAERFTDPNAKALLLLATARKLGSDDARFSNYFDRAMDQLRSSPVSRSKLYCLSEAYVYSKSIKRKEYEEIEDSIFATANELSAAGRRNTKDAKGSEDEMLLPPANFLFGFIYVIAKEDLVAANEMLPRIQHPSVRSVAQISVEIVKKYPLPKEEEN